MLAPPAVAVAAAPPLDNTFAWALAIAPALGIVLDIAFRQFGLSTLGAASFLVVVALNTVLVIFDEKRLEAAGVLPAGRHGLTRFLAVLLVPAYLILRRRWTGGSWVMPATWFAALILYVAAGSVIAQLGGVEIDSSLTEDGIEQWAATEASTETDVSCPHDPIVSVGGSFQCQATTDDVEETVDVTVTSTAGDITWQVRPGVSPLL